MIKYKKKNIYFLNIGVAGGQSEHSNIGNCYLINKIQDDLTKKSYYPDIIIKHSFEEKDIITVEASENDIKEYYDENKLKYLTEEKRKIEYITFNLNDLSIYNFSLFIIKLFRVQFYN